MAARKRHQNQNIENSRRNVIGDQPKHKTGLKKNEATSSEEGGLLYKVKEQGIGYIVLVLALACCAGYLNWSHVRNMFEQDRHFSHLSTLERELCFRTEMGLYYSYYKTMIEAPTFGDGLHAIMYDNVTEYPLTINTLKRFNLYPEVVLGLGKRVFESVMMALNKPTKMCWTVNRGNGMSPVQSCEGLGEPSYFYTDAVFLLNGVMMSVFFLFGTYLSGSVFGGLLTVLGFFYNHGEGTRVQWTPPLRESFAYPFLVVQMLIVTYSLKIPRPSYIHSILIAIATVCFMLPWQFAQFALLMQIMSVFATYALMFIGSHKMKVVLHGHMLGLAVSCILLFGNEMLMTSFFAGALVTIFVIVQLEPLIEKLGIRFLIWCVQGSLLIIGTVAVKMVSSKLLLISDDAHIGDIFRSKFGTFKNFHTMLYTCAKEFDFLEKETPWKLTLTFLLPATVVAFMRVIVQVVMNEYNSCRHDIQESEEDSKDVPIEHRTKPHAEVIYHVFQLLAFSVMAIMIMRLKLFWTPQLAIFSSLLASRQFFGWIGSRGSHGAVIVVLCALMSIEGIPNLQHQMSIRGEFSNMPMEEMIEWIKAKTPPNAVFAGPMPTMATIKLSANRPIVNHPHYEDAGLRERTRQVYSIYSRKEVEQVKQNLINLHVDYVVLEDSWCFRQARPGCRMCEIWDLEDTANLGKTPVCEILSKNPEPHFKRVFKNNVYAVLKVK